MRTSYLSFVSFWSVKLVPHAYTIAIWNLDPCYEHQRNQTRSCLVTEPPTPLREYSRTASPGILPLLPLVAGTALIRPGKVACFQWRRRRRRRRRRDADARVVAAARVGVQGSPPFGTPSREGDQALGTWRPEREKRVERGVLYVLPKERAQKRDGLFAAASAPDQMPEKGKCGVTLRRQNGR